MKILKVKGRNFGPYGSNWIEFDFSNTTGGCYALIGQNGVGKSTIMEIIQFALFGKVANKKLKSLPNRFNQNLEVYIEIQASQKNIIIERGIDPTYFRVSVNGDASFGDKAGKLDVQDILENEIYGIPYHIFNNIISLSVNDFKSFIKMSPKDKRVIIDKIFGLSIINDMFESLKIDIRNIKEKNNELTGITNSLLSQIDRTTEELERLNQTILENDSNRSEELKQYLSKLKKMKETLDIELNELNIANKQRQFNISQIEGQIYENKSTIKKLADKLDLYKQDKCPVCENNLQTEYYKEIERKLIYETKTLETTNESLQQTLEESYQEKEKVDHKQMEIKNKLQKVDINNSLLLKELRNLENVSRRDMQTLSMKKLISQTKKELEIAQLEQKKIENKRKFYEIIEDVLGENGIKQMALRNILPHINTQIGQYIKELGLSFNLEFDEKFNAKIIQFNEEIDPSTLSTGENKKLDFAVIISIIKLMKIKFPGLNLLFLDEIFSSLDSNSVHHVLDILVKTCKELQLHIFVVNHAPLDNNVFDFLYKIEKNNQYSTIVIEKIN